MNEGRDADRGSLGRLARRLGFEMLVVFLGVLAAFWFEARRSEKEAVDRAVRILEAMQDELEQDRLWHRRWADSIADERSLWETARANGERPPPFLVRMIGSETGSRAAWDAALSSDVLSVLDPALVREIGSYYSERTGIGVRWSRYMEQTEQTVFPLLAGSQEAFYAGESLRPEFVANMRLLDEVMFELNDKWQTMSLATSTRIDLALSELRR